MTCLVDKSPGWQCHPRYFRYLMPSPCLAWEDFGPVAEVAQFQGTPGVLHCGSQGMQPGVKRVPKIERILIDVRIGARAAS